MEKGGWWWRQWCRDSKRWGNKSEVIEKCKQ
jgi:hypothetical protein